MLKEDFRAKKLAITLLLVVSLVLVLPGTAIAVPMPQANGSGYADLVEFGYGEYDFNFNAHQLDAVTGAATGKVRLTWDEGELQISLNGEVRYMSVEGDYAWIGFVIENEGQLNSYVIEIEDGEQDYISSPVMAASAAYATAQPDFSNPQEGLAQWFTVSKGGIRTK